MIIVIRKLGKAIGTAALLCLVAYIVFAILIEIINDTTKIDEVGEITFIIGFLLTLYFPGLSVFYWIIFIISPTHKWIENHSRAFQVSLIAAGFGMGLALSLEALSIQKHNAFPWPLIGIILSLSPVAAWSILNNRGQIKRATD